MRPLHNVAMRQRRRKIFLREWRRHRGYTLVQVAERIGMNHGNLSKIERGLVTPDLELLEILADEYNCDVPDLIMRDPTDPDGMWSIWDQAKPAQRAQIVELSKVIIKTGTNG